MDSTPMPKSSSTRSTRALSNLTRLSFTRSNRAIYIERHPPVVYLARSTRPSPVTRNRYPSVLSLYRSWFCKSSRVRILLKQFHSNTDMRADTRSRPSPSSSSEEDDEGKLSVEACLQGSDEPRPSKKKKNKDVPPQANFKSKRHRKEPFQACSSFSKKKKRSNTSLVKSGIDLEELLAQTYPKEIPPAVESAKQIPGEGSDRRSNRKKKRSVKKVSDSVKKWSGDEEVSLSMALLECSSPEGEINIAAFYQRAKESLHDEVSRSQLYDKMRGMRKRFRAIQSKLKEHNVPEDEFPYRTPQEPALYMIWKQIWGNNGDNHEIHAENPTENGVQDLMLIEFENPRKNGVETSREIENENSRENIDENPMEIEGENPRDYYIETPREKEAESPAIIINDDERENSGEIEGENPRGIEGENSRDIGSENPTKNQVTNPRGSGVDEEKEEEEQSLQNSVSHETPNTKENGVCKLPQSKSGGVEDNIKILLEKTESRLQASIEGSINRFAIASAAGANFQPFGGFGLEMGMENFLSRRMKELIDGVNSVKEFPGLDAVEAQELQQKWHALKIQELRMFCESLELLQKQCRLILKNAETSSSNDNHGS